MDKKSLNVRIALMPALIALVPKLSDNMFEKLSISAVLAKVKELKLTEDPIFVDSSAMLNIKEPDEAVALLALYFARKEPMALDDYLIVRRLRSPTPSPDKNYSLSQSVRERGKSFTSTKK